MISNCCGAENRPITLDGPDWADLGMCPDCRDHCDWVDDDFEPIEEEECEE